MKKNLTHVRLVDERQIAFGAKLGLDLSGCTVGSAVARIEDCLHSEFYGETPLRATEKQAELAAKFGYDITGSTRRMAHAVIADIMEQLDREAIISEGLAAGVTVINIHDKHPRQYVISTAIPQADLI